MRTFVPSETSMFHSATIILSLYVLLVNDRHQPYNPFL